MPFKPMALPYQIKTIHVLPIYGFTPTGFKISDLTDHNPSPSTESHFPCQNPTHSLLSSLMPLPSSFRLISNTSNAHLFTSLQFAIKKHISTSM
eukprot:TRINITY_DN111687_c0_g1_i1.p1 TRINITY_DN111687_c0_g1~~TRINITY_DN111687_c0_g1_i1.p1  ORF type:complete len:106 (+),score=13.82 TRINITY_DN111687_c0_g1_i1:37-318(+)